MSHFLPSSQPVIWQHVASQSCAGVRLHPLPVCKTSPRAAEGPLGHGTAQWQCQAPSPGLCHLHRRWRAPAGINVDGHGSACPGWAWQGLSSSVPGKCVKPPHRSAHTGVWVCHSPVSKLISGSLTRGIKSRSHNGIHSSSCPGKEQAPHCPLGLGLGQARVASAELPAGGPCPCPPSSLPQEQTGTGAVFL